MPVDEAKPEAERRAVSAGRGILYITAAKLWFMVGGYAILFALPRVLEQVAVGQWNVILSWVSPVNNVMVTATIQGVSHFAAKEDPGAVQRAALKLELLVGGVLALGFFAGAPLIARFEHDPALVPGLRIAASVVLSYALYAVFVGTANGARAFHQQAGLDATYSTLRAGLVLGGAVVAHSVLGAVSGFAAAAVLILGVSVVVVRLGRSGAFRPSALARYMGSLALYLLIVNVLMFVDLWLLKRLVFEGAARAGVADPASFASEQAAIYANGVQAFARMPYQLILSVTFVVFPLVSQATVAADAAKTRGYVERAMRYSLVALAAMVSGIAARPDALIALVGKKYLPGAAALPPLAAGYLAFSLLTIAGTIINGAGRTWPTVAIGAVTLAVDAGANFAALSWATAGGHDPQLAAAIATAGAMGLGLVIALVYLQRRFGASLPLTTIARCALCAAAAVVAGRAVPLHGRLALAAPVCAGLLFLVGAVATGELKPSELRALRRKP